MIYKCDREYRQTQRQPSFCAHSACKAWVYKIQGEELTGLFWPYNFQETFPWCSWDEDEITWSTRMSVCLVPHSPKSWVWKSLPSSSPERLPWPYPLTSPPCQSMQWTAPLPLSEDVEQDAFRWGEEEATELGLQWPYPPSGSPRRFGHWADSIHFESACHALRLLGGDIIPFLRCWCFGWKFSRW